MQGTYQAYLGSVGVPQSPVASRKPMPQEHSVHLIRSCELFGENALLRVGCRCWTGRRSWGIVSASCKGPPAVLLVRVMGHAESENQPVYFRQMKWLYASELSALSVLTDALLIVESACWQPMDE